MWNDNEDDEIGVNYYCWWYFIKAIHNKDENKCDFARINLSKIFFFQSYIKVYVFDLYLKFFCLLGLIKVRKYEDAVDNTSEGAFHFCYLVYMNFFY